MVIRRTACGLLALGALSRLRGDESPWDAATKEGLAALEQGYREKAQKSLELALDQAKKAGADELVLAGCVDTLAAVTGSRDPQQQKLYHQSLEIRERRLKADDPEIA